MKKLLIIFTLMSPYLFCAQESDSLGEVIISLPDSDTNKVHALVDLAAIHYHDNLDTSKILVTEALILAKKHNYTRGVGFSNTAMSGYFSDNLAKHPKLLKQAEGAWEMYIMK